VANWSLGRALPILGLVFATVLFIPSSPCRIAEAATDDFDANELTCGRIKEAISTTDNLPRDKLNNGLDALRCLTKLLGDSKVVSIEDASSRPTYKE